MSLLQSIPQVRFDKNNVEHRRHFYRFLNESKWGNSPRFILETPFLDIPSMIQSKMLHHYMENEFAIKPKKTISIKEIK